MARTTRSARRGDCSATRSRRAATTRPTHSPSATYQPWAHRAATQAILCSRSLARRPSSRATCRRVQQAGAAARGVLVHLGAPRRFCAGTNRVGRVLIKCVEQVKYESGGRFSRLVCQSLKHGQVLNCVTRFLSMMLEYRRSGSKGRIEDHCKQRFGASSARRPGRKYSAHRHIKDQSSGQVFVDIACRGTCFEYMLETVSRLRWKPHLH